MADKEEAVKWVAGTVRGKVRELLTGPPISYLLCGLGKCPNFTSTPMFNRLFSIPGVAKHLVNFASLLLRHCLKFSECFWALLTVKHGRFFTLVLFGYRYEK